MLNPIIYFSDYFMDPTYDGNNEKFAPFAFVTTQVGRECFYQSVRFIEKLIRLSFQDITICKVLVICSKQNEIFTLHTIFYCYQTHF